MFAATTKEARVTKILTSHLSRLDGGVIGWRCAVHLPKLLPYWKPKSVDFLYPIHSMNSVDQNLIP